MASRPSGSPMSSRTRSGELPGWRHVILNARYPRAATQELSLASSWHLTTEVPDRRLKRHSRSRARPARMLSNPDTEKPQPVMAAMLEMKKVDIEGLERAAEKVAALGSSLKRQSARSRTRTFGHSVAYDPSGHDGGGASYTRTRIHRPHRHWHPGSRSGQGVLRRPHVRPRAPRVVRNWSPRTTNLRARRCARLAIVLLPGRGTGHLPTPPARPSSPRILGREQSNRPGRTRVGSCARRHHPRRTPGDSPSTGHTVLRRTGSIPMDSSWRLSATLPKRARRREPSILARRMRSTNSPSSNPSRSMPGLLWHALTAW